MNFIYSYYFRSLPRMKITGILVIWVLLALHQDANTAGIQEGTGETFKLMGVSKARVTIGDNAIVRIGAEVEIKCPVSVSPEEIPRIEWEIDGVQLNFTGFNADEDPNIRRYTEMTLTIYNIAERHAATYTCVLTYESNEGVATQRADTRIELVPECPESCQGEIGAKGYPGSRGQEGPLGRSGLPGICYPEECPRPESGVKGDKGASGSVGQVGPDGDIGADGPDGERGENGMVGDQGRKGLDGDPGGEGDNGNQGAGGPKGLPGDGGDEGERGDNGQKGMQGMQGNQGPTGIGPVGDNGDPGDQGEIGVTGDAGRKGVEGSKGFPGDRGSKGDVGNMGTKGGDGNKGSVGMRIIIRELNSTFNPDCREYEMGQIVFDTVIDRFVYCNGNTFQCVRDRPCFDECDETAEATLTETPEEKAKCINLIYVIDESASMRPEHQWLVDVSAQIPVVLEQIGFVPSPDCTNYFGVLRFGADSNSGKDRIGRPLDLGGATVNGQRVPLWGPREELVARVTLDEFLAAGRLEDGYAAIYRSLQQYAFIHPACRKIILITDEDRDNLTPTSDPEETRIPTLLNPNMKQTLLQFSIVLSAIVNLTIEVDASLNIPSDRILAILPGNRIVYLTSGPNPAIQNIAVTGNIELKIPDGTELTQNTKDTYFVMVEATGGILWSLPVSREFREDFTRAFLFFEVIPNLPTSDGQPNPDTECTVVGCNNCSCIDRENQCRQIQVVDFETTEQCRPTECNMTVVIDGFRQPSCVDMVFTIAETELMEDVHENIQDVAIGLVSNLARINFGQENSLCQNQYCLMTFGEANERVPDSCYAESFSPTPQQLCGTSSEIGGYIIGFNFNSSGFSSDGYSAIYSALRSYPAEFQDQSCRHITLITNGARSTCESFQTDGNFNVPELDKADIQRDLERENIILNVIVAAEFEDGEGREALGVFKDLDGTVKAIVPTASGFEESPGGKVKDGTAQLNIDSAYIQLALSRVGSAWDIKKMGRETDSFTQAFVGNVVVRSSEACGRTRACVECRCVSGLLQRCEDSSVCIEGVPPDLRWTAGNITIRTNNVIVDVGGYGDTEERVFYGLDGDLVTRFTIGSSLRSGTQPVEVTWYYVDVNGNNIRIEDSAVARYASVSTTNPYNLIFSEVGDFIQGSYVLIAENEHGTDTQITTIGILPKWDKTASGTVTGTQAQLGQTLIARTGSEVRIDGIVREGTREWSFQWFYNGVELTEGTDYSFEYSGNFASIIIHNFQSSGVGAYTAVVRNRYGEDRHTFNLVVQTVVSCDNNPESTATICSNCIPDGLTGQATLTLYAHSFPENQQLRWVRKTRIGGNRNTISTTNIILGANQLVVPVADLCVFEYEVVVIGQNTYLFICPCEDCVSPTETLGCCGESQRLLTESDCGENFFADIFILVDVSASMDTEHAFLREFLPRFESSLRGSCVGNSSINPNQYTVVGFGSTGDKEYPYFVGPDLDRGDSTQGVFFTIDPNDDSNVTRTIARLPTVGQREDGIAATNFAVLYGTLRDESLRFAILVTDEYRDFFYQNQAEVIASSTLFDINNFEDYGRSLYVDLLRDNNIIPIQIIDVDLSSISPSGNIDCLGVSSAETCFYRLPGSTEIFTRNNTQVINTVENQVLASIHIDYLQTAMDAGGYVWDLKVIRRNETGNWDAITDALTNEALTRASEELTQCRDCRCLPGGRRCVSVPLTEQRGCKCALAFPDNPAYCDCDIRATNTIERNFCICFHIEGFSEAFCRSVGQIEKVGP